MAEKHKLTQAGIDNLNKELQKLKTVDRPKNLEALKEARSQGDLSENADYDAAREEQAYIDSKIKEIENILKNVELIEEDFTGKANIGKNVTIKYLDTEEVVKYNIVGSIEADPLNFKISNESPIGVSVIGREVGDKIKVKTETNNEFEIEILEVE